MDAAELIRAIQTLNAEDVFHPRLDAQQWRVFCQFLTRHDLKSGDLLIKQGDHDRTVYFLESGSLQVFVSPTEPGTGSRIAILRSGSMVGEPGLFTDAARMANVEASTHCVVWALRLPRFEELVARMPPVAVEILRAAGSVMAVRMAANLHRHTPMA
jgi:CRP/FNR family transcriptional regulator, cyclic AMP receptor protein